MVGRPWHRWFRQRTDEMARFMRKRCATASDIEHYETRLHKDGHPIEISVTTSPSQRQRGQA